MDEKPDGQQTNRIQVDFKRICLLGLINDTSVLSAISKDQFAMLYFGLYKGTISRNATTRVEIFEYIESLGIKFAEVSELSENSGLLGYYLGEFYFHRHAIMDLLSLGIKNISEVTAMSYTQLFETLKTIAPNHTMIRMTAMIQFLNDAGKLPQYHEEDATIVMNLRRSIGPNFNKTSEQ